MALKRRCKECQKEFLSPESYRTHKRRDGFCRSDEALIAVGFNKTPTGWIIDRELRK